MERIDQRPVETDGHLARGTCDYCGHGHATYVGGRPTGDGPGGGPGWERHVCLGCLMRAGVPGGFDPGVERRAPGPAVGRTAIAQGWAR